MRSLFMTNTSFLTGLMPGGVACCKKDPRPLMQYSLLNYSFIVRLGQQGQYHQSCRRSSLQFSLEKSGNRHRVITVWRSLVRINIVFKCLRDLHCGCLSDYTADRLVGSENGSSWSPEISVSRAHGK